MIDYLSDKDQGLRIGFFCDISERGGVQTYTALLSRHLKSLGMECVLIVPRPRDRSAEEILAELEGDANRVITYDQPRNNCDLVTRLREQIKAAALDVFVPNFRITTYAAVARLDRIVRPRVLGICHDDHAGYYSMLWSYQSIVDMFICPSLKTHRVLSSLLPERRGDVRHIPHMLELPKLEAPLPPDKTIHLLYHGRVVEEQKNVSFLIRLGEILLRRGVPFRMTIVGDGPAKDRCRRLATDLGLEHLVDFQASCRYPELIKYFQVNHVSLLTSTHEGFCFSLAEAMSAGLPGLAFACGGVVEEYLSNGVNGFIVPFGDLDAMADRVLLLLRESRVWTDLSKAARATFQSTYSAEPVVAAYLALIREVVDLPRRANWSPFRPVHPEEKPRLIRSLIGRIGASLGAWPSSEELGSLLRSLGNYGSPAMPSSGGNR